VRQFGIDLRASVLKSVLRTARLHQYTNRDRLDVAAGELDVLLQSGAIRSPHQQWATSLAARNIVAEPAHHPLKVDGKPAGRWSRDGAGRLTVQIEAAHLNDDRHLVVLKSIAAALKA
jgi:hypothetical protein